MNHSAQIVVQAIRVGELIEFAERVLGSAQAGQFVPITMQRAVAHAHNPYASKDDVALLVAVDEDDEIVGYFGILPVMLRAGDELHKVHWFSTWSVSSKVRGRGVGSLLMKAALELKQDYLIVGSVHARRVCRKFGFWEREPLVYYWLDLTGAGRLNPVVWARRGVRKILHLVGAKRTLQPESSLSRRLDAWMGRRLKKVFTRRLNKRFAPFLEAYHLREVDQLRGEPPSRGPRPEVELYRGVEAVNWMLRYPWVLESGQSLTEDKDYYFSDTRPLFRQFAVEIESREGEGLGYAVFSVSQRGHGMHLRALDYHLPPSLVPELLPALALHYGEQYRADTLELPSEAVVILRRSLLGRLLLKRRERIYMAMPRDDDSPLARNWGRLTFRLVDGDMAFS
ncbi:MAG: GNAT family N-acetyltransferase [Anaerolineae bacterium]|nr:MAG: GNAT family N-acetyltransferase [Anaerolineae bacterium]